MSPQHDRWVTSYALTRLELDRRDNITTRYADTLNKWIVCRGAVMVASFDNQADAMGYARRLCDGEWLDR